MSKRTPEELLLAIADWYEEGDPSEILEGAAVETRAAAAEVATLRADVAFNQKLALGLKDELIETRDRCERLTEALEEIRTHSDCDEFCMDGRHYKDCPNESARRALEEIGDA